MTIPAFTDLVTKHRAKRLKAIRKLLAQAYVGTQAAMTDKMVDEVVGNNMLSRLATLADSPIATMQQALTLVDSIQEEANAAVRAGREATPTSASPASTLN